MTIIKVRIIWIRSLTTYLQVHKGWYLSHILALILIHTTHPFIQAEHNHSMSSLYPPQSEVDFVLEDYFTINSDNTESCKQGHLPSHRNHGTFAASTSLSNLKDHAKKCFKVSFPEKNRLGTLIQEYISDVSLRFLLIWIIKDSVSI